MVIEEVVSRSVEDTESVGRRLGERLQVGQMIHLLGDLGAGKTAFVRGLAEGLGIDPDEVSSPTFTLVQEYKGRVTLFHVDLYRLAGAEVADLGLDALAAEGIVVIEWANRLPSPDGRAIIIRIDEASDVAPPDGDARINDGDEPRRIRIEMPGDLR
jgi:tRNA threonylcarbamoyladenosine biosynthesis protein TsaE